MRMPPVKLNKDNIKINKNYREKENSNRTVWKFKIQ